MKKTREEYIEEYSQLGNTAIPIAIYDVGEKLANEIRTIGYDLDCSISKNLEIISSTVKYSSQAFQYVCSNLTDSHHGVFLYLKNFLRK